MAQPEQYEILVLRSEEGGKYLAWHMRGLGGGPPSRSGGGSGAPVLIGLRGALLTV